MKKITGFIFMFLGIGSIALAIWTFLLDVAIKPCLLGYFTRCSFTPISTLILAVLSTIFVMLGWKLIKNS